VPAWPHAPLHKLAAGGVYIVTAATYKRAPLFRTGLCLKILHDALLTLSSEHGWDLQAWAVFPNHFHFVAASKDGRFLPQFIQHLHSSTARELNERDMLAGRKVWFQYWETRITNQRSYFARLHYVHENAVYHGIVSRAANYPWCSAGWFERKASPAFRKMVFSFPCDRISIQDAFEVKAADIEGS